MKQKKKVSIAPYDASEHLKTEKDIVAYMEAAVEDGDPQIIAAAIGHIAKARGMMQVARDSGLAREHLYKALSSQGHPEFETIIKVMRALGLKFSIKTA